LWLTAGLVILLDQATKAGVMRVLRAGESWPQAGIGRFVSLTLVSNTGAAFGIFRDYGSVFVVIALVVVAAILIYQRSLPRERWMLHGALGLQLGGAVGNLIDRLRLGYVVDFIDFKFWPVFNLADSAIVIGVLALGLIIVYEERAARQGQAAGPGPGGTANRSSIETSG
jgi:signal peptidase II